MSVVSSLQVLASPRLAGAEMTYLRCVLGLRAAGAPTHVAVKRDSALARAFGSPGAPYEMGMSNYIDVRSMLAIRSLIRQHDCAVVQSWMSRGTWLTRAPRGVLHVARLGGYYRPRYFRHCDAWVTVTHSLRDWMIDQGFPADRIVTIPNFIPTLPSDTPSPLMREQLGIPAAALVVVAMGRFIPKKGFQDLIPAFAALGERAGDRPLHLLLMGSGPYRADLETLAAPIASRVHFTGWIDAPVTVLPIADVFVCPSREEAHGNVMLEAWSRGLPVIATRCDGPSELIQHGDNGWLCEVADPESLRQALRCVIDDRPLAGALAQRGSELFSQRHSEAGVVEAYLDFYGSMRRKLGY